MAQNPIPEVVFSFGPNNGFFFEHGGNRRWKNLPKCILNVVSASGRYGIKQTFCVSMAPGGGNIIVYKDKNGINRYAASGIPKSLRDWIADSWPVGIFRKGRMDLSSLKVMLYTKKGYFATATNGDGERAYRWGGLPNDVERLLQICVPRLGKNNTHNEWSLTLGVAQNLRYILHQSCTAGEIETIRNLDDEHYGRINEMINRSCDFRGWYVVLSNFVPDEYFLLHPDGTADWNVNKSITGSIESLAGMILKGQSVHGSTSLSTGKRKHDDDEEGNDGRLATKAKIEAED